MAFDLFFFSGPFKFFTMYNDAVRAPCVRKKGKTGIHGARSVCLNTKKVWPQPFFLTSSGDRRLHSELQNITLPKKGARTFGIEGPKMVEARRIREETRMQ